MRFVNSHRLGATYCHLILKLIITLQGTQAFVGHVPNNWSTHCRMLHHLRYAEIQTINEDDKWHNNNSYAIIFNTPYSNWKLFTILIQNPLKYETECIYLKLMLSLRASIEQLQV